MTWTPELARRVRSLFDRVIEMDGDAAEALLASECDTETRDEVLRILRAEREAASFLTTPFSTHAHGSGSPVPDVPPPSSVGPYLLLDRLGAGGMGLVFRARRGSERPVAVKIVRHENEATFQALRREIHALSRLRHPGIVRILDTGSVGGIVWYAMELLDGTTMRRELAAPGEEGKPPGPDRLARLLSLMRQLCAPLSYLHGEGLVHRDLKPDNVVVTRQGMPVIVDFGLATAFHAGAVSREMLEVGTGVSGTCAYMSPEQARGEVPDARADLYALGCMLYEIATGRTPFDGAATAVLMSHLTERPVPPSAIAPGVTPELEGLVMRLLEKEPRARLGHAEDVAVALAGCGAAGAAAGDHAPAARPYLYRSRLVGRERETAELAEAASRLRKGRGGMVLLGGPSGVGKTRLVMHVARDAAADAVEVLAGECPPRDRAGAAAPLAGLARPLQAIADRCRAGGPRETERVVGARGPVLQVVEPAFASLPGQESLPPPAEIPPEAARLRLFAAVQGTLHALATLRPHLLVLDDLHWADDLTLGLLAFLARGDPATPLLVVGTYRAEEVSPDLRRLLDLKGVARLTVAPLGEPAVAEMVEEMLAVGASPELVEFLARQSEGNPFYVAEYLRTAMARGVLRRDGAGQWHLASAGADEATFDALGLPASIRELVASHIDGLGATARELLSVASVLGRESPERLLSLAAGLGDEEALLTGHEILSLQLMEPGTVGLRFAHDKVREVTYGMLPEPRRRELHRRAAEAIEGAFPALRDTDPASLGHHWSEAGEPRRARGYLLAGARLAWPRFAHAEAERLFHAYLSLVESPSPESIAARLELARRVYDVQGRLAEAEQESRRALHDARGIADGEGEIRATSSLAWNLRRMGRLEEATALCGEALRRCEALGLAALRHDLEHVLAGILTAAGRLEELGDLATAGLQRAREEGNTDHEAEMLTNLSIYLEHRGDLAESAVSRERSLELARARAELAATCEHLLSLGRLRRRQGKLEEARAALDSALQVARATGDLPGEAKLMIGMASVAEELGDPERASALLTEALVLSRRIGDLRMEGLLEGNLSSLLAARGDLDESLERAGRSLRMAREGGFRSNEAFALAQLGDVHVARREWRDALARYQEALTTSRELGLQTVAATMLVGLASVERRSGGDLARAAALVAEAEVLLARLQDPGESILCLVERGLVELARGEDGAPFLARARAIATSLGRAPGDRLGQAIGHLERAVAAAAAGLPLTHGEAPVSAVPP